MKIVRALLIILFIVVSAGCQTMYKGADDGSDTGVWEGKVKISDKKNGQKIWGNVTWVSESKRNRLRVDVKGPLDVAIATFIMQDGHAELWLYQEDKHYLSESPERLFATLTKINMDPKIFFSLLSKTSRLQNPWKCMEENEKMKCSNSEQKVSLVLQNQDSNTRRVTLKKATSLLKIHLVRSKVEVIDRMFKHKPTSQFERITI